jgi:hypothetical protein
MRNLSKEKSKERDQSNDKNKYGSNFSTLGWAKYLSSNTKSKKHGGINEKVRVNPNIGALSNSNTFDMMSKSR